MITCTFEHGNTGLLRHAVVDVVIVHDNKLLMVKRAEKLSEGGKWALAGGFVGRDETIKDAVVREALEETGYTIHHVQLLTIRDNPDRRNEDRQNISFVFIAEAGDKTGQPDWEVSETKWFAMDALPKQSEIAFDHYKNIQLYLEYQKKAFPLPFIK